MLSLKRITKALIRLCGCAGWSAPVIFTNLWRKVFSRWYAPSFPKMVEKGHMILAAQIVCLRNRNTSLLEASNPWPLEIYNGWSYPNFINQGPDTTPLQTMRATINSESTTTEPSLTYTRPHSTVGNVPDYRCASDCRSRGLKFDPGPVPYFRGDWSWNNFYGHSSPFPWIVQECLLSVARESMCTKYW